MTRGQGWLLGVALVLGVSAFLLMGARVGERGRFAVPYSSFGAGPEGTRGLFELVRRSGHDARRWSEELLALPPSATLVTLGGCEHLSGRDLSRVEREALLRWIEAGGTWIVAGAPRVLERDDFGVRLAPRSEIDCAEGDGLLQLVLRADQRIQEREREARERDAHGAPDGSTPPPSEPPSEPPSDEPELSYAVARGGALEGLGGLGMQRTGTIRFVEGAPAHETLATIGARDALVVVPRGAGRIVVASSASLFQNRELTSHEGAALFMRLLRRYGRGPVLFDEYHLGAGQPRSAMRYLFQRGGLGLALQILFILALVLVRSGRAFGAPREAPSGEPATTASFLAALGALYARVREPEAALASLVRRALDEIAVSHHLEERDAERLERALRDRHRSDAADAVRAIAALGARTSRTSLDADCRELDRLTALALEHHAPTRGASP